MRSRWARSAYVLGLLALLAARPGAQQFVLSSQDRARLIAVDFSVVGADGLPIKDLLAADVTLKINGRARPIRSLEYIPAADASAVGEPTIGPSLLPYGSNTTPDTGRSIVLIIDQETIRPNREAPMKAHINAFLGSLGARDRVALLTLPYGSMKVDLTTEHFRISQALARVTGQASTDESASEASCRTGATLVALRGTLDDLRGGEAPVAVVLFSGQLSVPPGVLNLKSQPDVGRCAVRKEYYTLLGASAAAARAQFYIIEPDLTVEEGNRAGLEHLSGVTGAPLMSLGSLESSALSRVARETAGYYIARIEPEPSETTGSLRGLAVSVTRPHATVRQRPQVSVVRSTPSRFVNAKAVSPLDMMKDVRPFRDLPLRVTGYTSREPGTAMVRVVTLFDSPDPSAALSTAMVGLFDDGGRLVASRQLSGAELVGSPIVSALSVPPGHYRLRAAAAEAAGRGGSADVEVVAELAPAGPLTMSALVMGLSREGQFRPRLEFGAEASAIAYVEIYGAAEGDAVGAVFEVARTANGPALVTLPGTFAATADADKFTVTAALPIGALAPGDYVVRATVVARDKPGGRVLRALRKLSR